jgi:hypothetical protein
LDAPFGQLRQHFEITNEFPSEHIHEIHSVFSSITSVLIQPLEILFYGAKSHQASLNTEIIRNPPNPRQATAMWSLWRSLPALLLLPATISAIQLDCENIRVDEQSFNLKKLGGPKTVHWLRHQDPSIANTTFTVDICKGLLQDKDVKKEENCPLGTRVCAKEYDYREGFDERLSRVIAIAGEYTTTNGRALDPKFTRLKDSASNSDGKEGVVIELHGGKYPFKKSGVPQKAIIEFLCTPDVTGNEGFKDQSDLADPMYYGAMETKDDDEDESDLPDLDKGKNLRFRSYEKEGEIEVLRLRWKTKFACEGAADKDPGDVSSGWGFFTWLIIIVFLLAAAYIIFGSWLNYNRYGARGWDLIPHGDTIRDIPYIVKDWGSNVADRLKGGDSRGGYSAV